MKKYFLLTLVAAMMVAMPAHAGLKWGLKAGVNLSNVSFSEEMKDIIMDQSNYTGFQVGPIVEFTVPIVGIGLDAALLYSQNGFKMEGDSYTTGSILIPVNFKYKLSLLDLLGAYAAVGPYADFKVSDALGDIQETIEAKSFGAGLNVGLGVELLGKLQVGANYQIGLTDDYGASKALNMAFGSKTRVWSITAAFFF